MRVDLTCLQQCLPDLNLTGTVIDGTSHMHGKLCHSVHSAEHTDVEEAPLLAIKTRPARTLKVSMSVVVVLERYNARP